MRFLSCVISFIVLPTLPSPSSTAFLKFFNIAPAVQIVRSLRLSSIRPLMNNASIFPPENWNIALNKTPAQSSSLNSSSLVVSGSYVFVLGQQVSLTPGKHSWVHVDLGSSIFVNEVTTYFHRNESESRLYKLQVRIGDSQVGNGVADPQCGSVITVLSELKRIVRCAIPRLGRYVTIQRIGHGNLMLTEVRVPRKSKFLRCLDYDWIPPGIFIPQAAL